MNQNIDEIENKITNFIQKKVKDKKVVLGLSGGIDSAVCLKLCIMALGNQRVKCLIMPSQHNDAQDMEDAISLCKSLNVDYEVIELKSINQAFEATNLFNNKISRMNVNARIRMTLLYGVANSEDRIVIGTGNKSELFVGYFTKYGDGGVDILPIGDLYKTEVFVLAKHLGIPKKIITKKPSAGLYPGQTDEEELGMSYELLDKILMSLENGLDLDDLNVDQKLLSRVLQLKQNAKHKLEIAEICEL